MGGASAFLITQPKPGAAEPSHRGPQCSRVFCPPTQENGFLSPKQGERPARSENPVLLLLSWPAFGRQRFKRYKKLRRLTRVGLLTAPYSPGGTGAFDVVQGTIDFNGGDSSLYKKVR